MSNQPQLRTKHRALAMLTILAAALCAVGMGSFARLACSYVPTTEVVLFRSLITLIILAPILVYLKAPVFGSKPALIFLRSLTGFASLCLGFYALTRVPFVCISVLSKTSVIFTALLGSIFLRERISYIFVSCVAAAFLGTYLIVRPTNDMFNLGGIAVVASGATVALTSVSTRKLQETEGSATIVFGFSLWSTLLAVLFFHSDFIIPPKESFLPLLAMGLCGLVGQLLFTSAFKFAEASFVQSCSFAEVLMSLLIGVTFWHEIPDLYQILGGVCIVAACFGLLFEKRLKSE